ncbi:hypothetical protein LLE49_02990 [Alicyclobacillus tolerans]|uniref:hypothetical protein n=1 Tax=Alicyclobacillus tolerans TaxID=90970 RepID=UPI001F2777D8|nr:hypothetical protein [Alicyclobacillus tolerans]MCF8563706.1 hypothetical protein [Alicyclobacillus tolerans]
MDTTVDKVYLLSVEENGDDILTLEGVVIRTSRDTFSVYSTSTNHNLFRSVLHKHPWDDLVQGVHHRGREYRLTDITERIMDSGFTKSSSIPEILHGLYEGNPKHLFFLSRYFQSNSALF